MDAERKKSSRNKRRIEIHSKIAIIIRFRIAMSSFSCYFIIFSAAWIFHHFFSAFNSEIAFNVSRFYFVHHKLRYNYILLLWCLRTLDSFLSVSFFFCFGANLILNIRFKRKPRKCCLFFTLLTFCNCKRFGFVSLNSLVLSFVYKKCTSKASSSQTDVWWCCVLLRNNGTRFPTSSIRQWLTFKSSRK